MLLFVYIPCVGASGVTFSPAFVLASFLAFSSVPVESRSCSVLCAIVYGESSLSVFEVRIGERGRWVVNRELDQLYILLATLFDPIVSLFLLTCIGGCSRSSV